MLTASEAWMRFSSTYNTTSNMLGQKTTSLIVFIIYFTINKVPVQILQIKIIIKSHDNRIDIKKNNDIMI